MHGQRTALIHIPHTLTGYIYLQNAITLIIQSIRQLGQNFFFMDYNARTRNMQNALEEVNVQRFNWPTNSDIVVIQDE